MEIPESMRAELGAWNNGGGIDLESWVGCEGNFSLAVGYASLFWPAFVAFEGYVLREGFSVEALRGFEDQMGADRVGVEKVMNHIHLDSLQHLGCEDISADKLIVLGERMREIHEVKLRHDFPDRTFAVQFYVPPDADELDQYQLLFWQADGDRS